MSMRILATAVVVSIFLTIGSVCAEEAPRQTGVPVMIEFAEHAAAGGQDEVEGREIKARIVDLLAEAEEMTVRASELRAEARELESALEGRRGGGDKEAHMREIHRKADAMREVAEHFEREGHHEEAGEIREKADTLVAESERRDGRIGEGWRRAEDDEGRAAELWTRVEDIRVTLKRGDAGPEGIERLERKLAELSEAAERAAHAGRKGEARELRMEAERVAGELEEHHKHVKRAEVREAEQRLEDLEHAMCEAREHGNEERLSHLRREAEEVGRMLQRGCEHRGMADRMEGMHRELDELNQAAERAEREGNLDLAHEIHVKAMEVAEQIELHQCEMEEHPLREAEQHLENLHREMDKAREHGEEERLGHLEREAEEVERMLGQERENREMAEHMENMHREMEELNRAAERAEREGHHELAREVHGQAMEVEERIRRHEHEMQERHIHEAEERLEQLEHGAREAREQGRHDEAERMMAEAEEIERHLHATREGRRMGEQLERLHGVMEELQASYRHAMEEGRFDRAEEFRSLVDRMADMVAGSLDEDQAEHYERVERAPESVGGVGMKEISVVIRPADVDSDAEGEEAEEPRMHIEEPTFEPVETGAGVWDVDERIRQLRGKARRADEAGDHDRSRAFSTEARQLERSLLSMEEPEGVGIPSAEAPADDDVSRLRRDVRQLRRDLEELTKALRGKIDF